jgi:hypothetical protein
MRARTCPLIAAALLVVVAPDARAQDSVFGIRGLGFLGRPVSARSAGMGGGTALFDGSSAVSPASVAAFHGLAGWAVAAGSQHSFNPGTGNVSLSAMRFPTFGFATTVGSRLALGVSVSDYLNRNWDVQHTDTVMPRDTALAVTDRTRSLGGVSDIRFAAAYRLSTRLAVGVGLHVLSGAARTSVQRDFGSDTAYSLFYQSTQTDFHGMSVSVGAFLTPVPQVVLGASARFNGRLSATNPGGRASVRLPTELNAGLYVIPVDGVTLATTVGHANWSVAASDLEAAGQAPSRDVWSVGIGAEVALLRTFGGVIPVRAGYRWRQLPFLVGTDSLNQRADALSEQAISGGISLVMAGGRATVDVAVEAGSRAAGALKERFQTVLVGLTILP